MLQRLRSHRQLQPPLHLFRPVDDLECRAASTPATYTNYRVEGGLEGEMAKSVMSHRNGVVLTAHTILKVDRWSKESASNTTTHTSRIDGAFNFRRIHRQICAVAQPTISGMTNVVNYLENDKITRVCWINLREEPLIYINGVPYVLRDHLFTVRNIHSFSGITSRRLELLEDRLREDVLSECHAYEDRILLHQETPDGCVEAAWVMVAFDEIVTLKQATSSLVLTNCDFSYFRIPMTAELSPLPRDVDLIFQCVCGQRDLESTAFVLYDAFAAHTR